METGPGYRLTPSGRDGKIAQEVSDIGRVSVYQNGQVLFQPDGMKHPEYKQGIAKPFTLSDLGRPK